MPQKIWPIHRVLTTQLLISQTIFPLFLEVEDIELSKEAKALGFPIIHKHKLCCLRQELIDAFVESRYMMFIKYAAVQLQQLGLKKQMDIFQKKPEQPAIKDDKSDDSPAEGNYIIFKMDIFKNT